jgi:hypothetical protein
VANVSVRSRLKYSSARINRAKLDNIRLQRRSESRSHQGDVVVGTTEFCLSRTPRAFRRITRACSRTGQQRGVTTFCRVWHQSIELQRAGQPVAQPLKRDPLGGRKAEASRLHSSQIAAGLFIFAIVGWVAYLAYHGLDVAQYWLTALLPPLAALIYYAFRTRDTNFLSEPLPIRKLLKARMKPCQAPLCRSVMR